MLPSKRTNSGKNVFKRKLAVAAILAGLALGAKGCAPVTFTPREVAIIANASKNRRSQMIKQKFIDAQFRRFAKGEPGLVLRSGMAEAPNFSKKGQWPELLHVLQWDATHPIQNAYIRFIEKISKQSGRKPVDICRAIRARNVEWYSVKTLKNELALIEKRLKSAKGLDRGRFMSQKIALESDIPVIEAIVKEKNALGDRELIASVAAGEIKGMILVDNELLKIK